ncbi:hypothetical protein Tco_0693508 [Tanacetum coccineum]
MTTEKDDRPTAAAGGIDINNGMNDTTVIPFPGASHHMTCILEDLSNLKEIVQWPVELPDGNIAMAKKEELESHNTQSCLASNHAHELNHPILYPKYGSGRSIGERLSEVSLEKL